MERRKLDVTYFSWNLFLIFYLTNYGIYVGIGVFTEFLELVLV